jgi:hypothetical protein
MGEEELREIEGRELRDELMSLSMYCGEYLWGGW